VSKPESPPPLQQLAHVVINGNKAQHYRKLDKDFEAEQSNPSQPEAIVRPASKAQRRFAGDLGIEFDENITNRELSELIDSALPTFLDSSPVEIVNQLENCGLKTVMITWRKAEMELNPTQTTLELISSASVSLCDIHFVLAAVVSQILAEEDLTFPEYLRGCAERQRKMVTARGATESDHGAAENNATTVNGRIPSTA
jgi:hypothetical protein